MDSLGINIYSTYLFSTQTFQNHTPDFQHLDPNLAFSKKAFPDPLLQWKTISPTSKPICIPSMK